MDPRNFNSAGDGSTQEPSGLTPHSPWLGGEGKVMGSWGRCWLSGGVRERCGRQLKGTEVGGGDGQVKESYGIRVKDRWDNKRVAKWGSGAGLMTRSDMVCMVCTGRKMAR